MPEAIPDERNVPVLLASASLDAIAKASTEAAAEGKSFLAHGNVVGKGLGERFGIALLAPMGRLPPRSQPRTRP